MVADIEELLRMDASEIHAKRLNAKEVLTPQRGGDFIFPNADRTFKKTYQPNKVTFYFPAEEWVLPAASTKEPEEREFVVDSGASMHMVSKSDLNSAELDIEEADDGDDVQRRGANQRRSHGICQRKGPIRDSYAS